MNLRDEVSNVLAKKGLYHEKLAMYKKLITSKKVVIMAAHNGLKYRSKLRDEQLSISRIEYILEKWLNRKPNSGPTEYFLGEEWVRSKNPIKITRISRITQSDFLCYNIYI